MKQEVLNLADEQIQQVISNALNCLTLISSSQFQNRSLKPNAPLRCRSSSNNRKVPFHNTLPRCSLPATKNDLVHYQLHLLSSQQANQTRSRTPQNSNTNGSNRISDVQYSFSLNKSWSAKINQQRHCLISTRNFVDELIEHSLQTALFQINYQTLIDENQTSCPSNTPNECLEIIDTYADEFIHSTIEQAIENIYKFNIECLSNRLANDIIADALSTIADDEKYLQKIKKQSENTEQQTSLFNQIPYHSLSVSRMLTNNSLSNEASIDSLVNSITQQVYMNSFDELRKIFITDNNND